MQAMSKGLEKVEQEIAMSKNDGHEFASIRKVLFIQTDQSLMLVSARDKLSIQHNLLVWLSFLAIL